LAEAVSEIRDARARRDTSLRSRERVVEASSAIAFVATAFAFALAGRGDVGDLRIATAATLIAMLGALGQVEFEIGRGAAVPTQLASVPLDSSPRRDSCRLPNALPHAGTPARTAVSISACPLLTQRVPIAAGVRGGPATARSTAGPTQNQQELAASTIRRSNDPAPRSAATR
jgi:hypothetical protein